MERGRKDLLPTLKRIAQLAQALTSELPAGLARHRAHHIAALARQIALDAAIREKDRGPAGPVDEPSSPLFG